MKTVDGVINKLIECHTTWCRWSEKSDIVDRDAVEEAIQYLKAYRDDRDELAALRAFWKEQHENEPLTWDELKAMEGKPVWVEYCKTYKDEMDGHIWVIIHTAYEEDEDGEAEIFCNDMCRLRKKWQGKTWQAYRKEEK